MEFIMRPWMKEDAKNIARYANNKKIADNLRNVFPHPYTLEDAVWYVNDCIAAGEERQLIRAIVVKGEAVGSIGIFRKEDVYEKSAELGYWLGEPFWNKGIMSAAIVQLCEESMKRYDIVRIFAEPFAFNVGSRRALEKSGFQLEGILRKSVCKNGVIFDSCMYALTVDREIQGER